jgi:hypothetical protein
MRKKAFIIREKRLPDSEFEPKTFGFQIDYQLELPVSRPWREERKGILMGEYHSCTGFMI